MFICVAHCFVVEYHPFPLRLQVGELKESSRMSQMIKGARARTHTRTRTHTHTHTLHLGQYVVLNKSLCHLPPSKTEFRGKSLKDTSFHHTVSNMYSSEDQSLNVAHRNNHNLCPKLYKTRKFTV
jgi:hypothetical protein